MSIFVEVSNLGPLRSAEVEMADLTLFVGDNNTGKTFFATVLHRILGAASSQRDARRMEGEEVPVEVLKWFEQQLVSLDADTLFQEDPPRQPTKAALEWATQVTTTCLKVFGADVRGAIEYAYGVEASELRRKSPSRRSSDCYLRVCNSEPKWEVEVRFDSDIVLVVPPDPAVWLERLLEEERDRLERAANPGRRGRSRFQSLMSRLSSQYFGYWPLPHQVFSGWPQFAVHLPASRTGIMESYQVLAGAVVRQAAAAGIRPIEIEALPGTSADFLSLLLSAQDRRTLIRRPNPQLRSLISEFEKDLRAEILLKERANSSATVLADTPEGTFPLSRTSSMISELAPVLLVLKGSVGRGGDHITIDEPEAHLHPAMQRTIASFIADVVNCGVSMVVTTHSDFFVGQISNVIRARKLVDSQWPPVRRKRAGSRPATVSALRFSRGDRWCEGHRLAIDPVDGLDESTFTEVMESLYDDSARLINELL